MDESGKQNIFKRLAAVARAVPYAKKDVDSGSGGKGVARDMVVAVTRKHFLDQGILVSTSQVDRGTVTFTPRGDQKSPKVTFIGLYETRFTNIDNPSDYFTVRHEGQGDDFGDKAPGKASTYAEKLNIIKALLIETGIGDEGRLPGDGEGDDDDASGKRFPVDQLDVMVEMLQKESDIAELRKKLSAFQKRVRAEHGNDVDIKIITEAATKRAGELKQSA